MDIERFNKGFVNTRDRDGDFIIGIFGTKSIVPLLLLLQILSILVLWLVFQFERVL